MKKVFLTYSFREEDRDLVSYVEHLLASHNILAVTGEGVGGAGLTPAVQKRIQDPHVHALPEGRGLMHTR